MEKNEKWRKMDNSGIKTHPIKIIVDNLRY